MTMEKAPMIAFIKERNGTAALEFAMIAPLFIILLLTTIAYGIYLSTAHSLQEMASDAARTALAGVSNEERLALATDFIRTASLDDPFIKRTNLGVEVKPDPANSDRFSVILTYDARNLPIWQLYSFALPDTRIRRLSTIRMGGR